MNVQVKASLIRRPAVCPEYLSVVSPPHSDLLQIFSCPLLPCESLSRLILLYLPVESWEMRTEPPTLGGYQGQSPICPAINVGTFSSRIICHCFSLRRFLSALFSCVALAFNESKNCNNLSEVIQFDSEKFTLCNRFSSSGKQGPCFCIPLVRMWFSVLVYAARKG